jgi:hypothetical protein
VLPVERRSGEGRCGQVLRKSSGDSAGIWEGPLRVDALGSPDRRHRGRYHTNYIYSHTHLHEPSDFTAPLRWFFSNIGPKRDATLNLHSRFSRPMPGTQHVTLTPILKNPKPKDLNLKFGTQRMMTSKKTPTPDDPNPSRCAQSSKRHVSCAFGLAQDTSRSSGGVGV